MAITPPLIVTLKLDETSLNYFTGLRNVHFPVHCNYLQAHLTLFHHLPSDNRAIEEVLMRNISKVPIDLLVSNVENIGKGNAFAVVSEQLQLLHGCLQQQLDRYLVSQDRKKLWPHITVQNKVTAYKAKQTTVILNSTFSPFNAKGVGFETWLYLKGPWQKRGEYLFG